MALREKRRARKEDAGDNPYNTKTYKIQILRSEHDHTKRKDPLRTRVISRTHIPKERVNQKQKAKKVLI